MCVLCMCYIDWEFEGRKNFRVGILLNKKLIKVGWQETNNFFWPYCLIHHGNGEASIGPVQKLDINPSNSEATFIQSTRMQTFLENDINPVMMELIG